MATADPSKAVRLLVRPSPFKGESLRGYLHRVGECNGLGSGIQVFRDVTGNNFKSKNVSDLELELIAHSLGLTQSQIEMMGYQAVAQDAQCKCVFFGHKIAAAHLRGSNVAICPSCLDEQNAISGLWDIRAVNACPHHGNWLVSTCPSCGQSINWDRRHISSCECGFDLRKTETIPAPPEALMQAGLIYQRVMRDLSFYVDETMDCPDWALDLPLNQLLSTIRYVENVLAPWFPFKRDICEDKAHRRQYETATLFAEIIKDWPNGFFTVLKEYSDSRDLGAVIAAGKFNSIYSRLLTGFKEETSLELPYEFDLALKKFREDLCINQKDSTGATRNRVYLNPTIVQRAPNGDWVIDFKDAVTALNIPSDESSCEQTVCFQDFLEMKAYLSSACCLLDRNPHQQDFSHFDDRA